MRNQFDRELEELNLELIQMGILIENSIHGAVEALITMDAEKAQTIVEEDQEVNRMEKEIERRCLRLILLQQPVAVDLRTISTALKMITDMERIGDQAADISEITLQIIQGGPFPLVHTALLQDMAAATIKMVKDAIDAFVHGDLDKARQVIDDDDIVDRLFVEVREIFIEKLRSDKDDSARILDLLMIAKYFERVGDHAANIGGWVVFSLTGLRKNEKSSEGWKGQWRMKNEE